MNDRIKQVRKTTKLTQSAFGERIGVKGNTVTGWESGIRIPSEAILTSISREFGVDEHWLRTGEGDMFKPVSRDEEIAAFMGDVMRGETDDFRRRLVAVLAKLDSEEWELLERMALKLVAECTKKEDQAEA